MKSRFDRIRHVAKEMQHFLWRPERTLKDGRISWWNCAEHAVLTGALMWINGYDVEMFAGKAFFAQGPKSNGASPCLHAVPKHWWISANNIGVIDFSPDLSVRDANWEACDFDYIFGNRVFARIEWSFGHTSRPETLAAQLSSAERRVDGHGCIYFRQNSKRFECDAFLGEHLITNQDKEPWAQAALLFHLQKLLDNERTSLRDLPVRAAWNELRSIPRRDIDAVTAKLMQ